MFCGFQNLYPDFFRVGVALPARIGNTEGMTTNTTTTTNLNDLDMAALRAGRTKGMDSVFMLVGRLTDWTNGHRTAEDMNDLRDSLDEFKAHAAKIIALAEQALAESEVK